MDKFHASVGISKTILVPFSDLGRLFCMFLPVF